MQVVDDPSSSLAPFGQDSTTPDMPRCSTDTLRSLDISHNIPNIVLSMDAEDSPWGGMFFNSSELPNCKHNKATDYPRCAFAVKLQRKS